MNLQREVNSILAKKTKISVIGQLFLSLAVVFSGWSLENFSTILAFTVVLITLNVFRYQCLIYYPHVKAGNERLWFYVYGTLTLGTSVGWGSFCAWVVYHFSYGHPFFLLLLAIISGLSAGSTAVLTPAKIMARSFVITLILPVSLSLVLFNPAPQFVIAGIITFFMFFLLAQVTLQTEMVWELRARRNQVVAFEEATMEGMIIHENGKIIQANASAELLFGYTREEFKNLSIQHLVPPEDHGPNGEKYFRDSKTPLSYRGIRKDGSIFYADVVGRWFTSEGRKVRVTCIQDATFRRQAEQLLMEREKAALELVEVKSQFLANMSHEIRTPLNAIVGLTDLLSETELTEVQKNYFRTLKDSSDSLISLVNDILDFSKIDAQKIELENVPFSLSSVVEAQVGLMAPRAHQKKVALHVLIDPHLPSLVLGDYGRVGQILLNLVSNAIKFTAHGSVLVTARRALYSENGAPARIRFEIKDTGMGIDDEQRSKLFRPFTQADNSMARRYGGTGLGLSICQKLVELMNGSIDLESPINQGTTFYFEIPLPVVDAKSIASSYPHTNWQDKQVALVCSDESLTQVLSTYLRSWEISSQVVAMDADALRQADLIFVSAGVELSGVLEVLDESTSKKVIVINEGQDGHWEKHRLVKSVLPLPVRYADLHLVLAQSFDQDLRVQAPLAKAITPDFGGFRVLVAEDNSTNQLIVLAVLRQLGLSAHAVANGIEAVDAFCTSEYDVILMDCQMPELDGYQATMQIREIEKNREKKIPIVALTANVMTEDRDRCLASGMNDFLSKPISKQKLVNALQKYLIDEFARIG